ncbi:hypothetical protein [Muricoccus radiodurans]|uniref:hypothetical protein n=1 Tax=Muricoccus radiodurans TaxID=2231721 RepID=UPI003CF05C3D
MSLFETEQQANSANDGARSWVQSHMRDLLPNAPEIFAGEAIIAVNRGQHDGSFGEGIQPFYVMVRQFADVSDPDFIERLTREITTPTTISSPGFKAFYAAWGDPGRTRAALVSLFDNRENAHRCYDRVKQLMREKGGAAIPPPNQIIAGETTAAAMSP